MMYPRMKFRCDRVRGNNGIVEVFFTRTDGLNQDQNVLINVVAKRDQYQEGQFYWIAIEPAFPH